MKAPEDRYKRRIEKRKGQYERLDRILYNCMEKHREQFEPKLKAALAKGFPVDFTDKDGNTLLQRSMRIYGTVEAGIPDLLLDCGADTNVADENGLSLLSMMITEGVSLKLLKRMIRAGADVDAQDEDGWTAFNYAAIRVIKSNPQWQAYGNEAICLLLDNGADPCLCSQWMKAENNEPEECRARREELIKLCEAYQIKRDKTRLREAANDTETFMR